jgi:hypothetical protein
MEKKNKGLMGRSDIPLAQRLTDANALLAEVVKAQALEPDKAIAKIITLITEAERVDAVEVVRCKDCVSYGGNGWCFEHDTCMEENDFCSYGERRTDNG